ncbi:MAG: FkbM family methyltransferase, partial [Elusimicrobiota bacterium]|nr:FkbM family methyltransferase [Elusimicrobiota bacterium]
DIEGAEIKLLKGAKETLKQNDLKLALCAYHNQNDEQELRNFLSIRNFTLNGSKGYMLMYKEQNFAPPYLRRGLIFAKKG